MPRNVEPPPPHVNLSGFPLPYRQGYADGCASATGAERKDAARFGGDGNYRTGWQDGLALCKKTSERVAAARVKPRRIALRRCARRCVITC